MITEKVYQKSLKRILAKLECGNIEAVKRMIRIELMVSENEEEEQ